MDCQAPLGGLAPACRWSVRAMQGPGAPGLEPPAWLCRDLELLAWLYMGLEPPSWLCRDPEFPELAVQGPGLAPHSSQVH